MRKFKDALKGRRGQRPDPDARGNSTESDLALQNKTSVVSADVPPQLDGVKVWYDCPEATVDICFVHGLTGNRETTWTAHEQTIPWPETLLPPRLNSARILTFGYDAYVVRKSVASSNRLIDHATNLLNDLTTERAGSSTSSRHIIFVAHSFGGLVCKEAILLSRNHPEDHLQSIFAFCKGIIFMGTPHRGSWMANWAKLPASTLGLVKSTNTSLLKVLQTDDQLLESIQNGFLEMVRVLANTNRPLRITCFVEELPLPGIGRVVSKESASLPGYTALSIHADHREMVRFRTAEDTGFKRLLGELVRWENEIRSTVVETTQSLQTQQLAISGLPSPAVKLPAEDNSKVQILSSTCCMYCENCKTGIAYYSDSYICLECKIWICQNCHKTHNQLHNAKVRFQARQWIDGSKEFTPTADCNGCSSEARSRIQCKNDSCSYALCIGCSQNLQVREVFLKSHLDKDPTHRVLYMIFPTYWYTTKLWRVDPCTCQSLNHPSSPGHCQRCHAPWEYSALIYGCRTCKKNFGTLQWLCEPCFLSSDEENVLHKQGHDFCKCKISYDANLSDDHLDRYYCETCKIWLAEGEQVEHTHPTDGTPATNSELVFGTPFENQHPDYIWFLSPLYSDILRLVNYRSCDKVRCLKDSVQYPDKTTWKCSQCSFTLAYDQIATICLKGGCKQSKYCTSCTNAHRIDHRHKSSMYTTLLQKKSNNLGENIDCSKCQRKIRSYKFTGIFCRSCKQFRVCIDCIVAAGKRGTPELEDKLPHDNVPNSQCTALDWAFVL